ncbi:MAG: hydroxyacid dehydrogenase [Deltaproteobacteria bacterium]|nr:hydroxyacid dehydrogenase [Deltaproteobacteria bacterium]
MKVVFFEIKGWEKKLLRKKLKGMSLEFSSEPLDENNVARVKDFDIVSIFIYSRFDRRILERIRNLRAIVTRSTGFDHIPLRECKRRGIVVSNVPFYGENTVAEHTFALILSLSRNVHKACTKTLAHDFSIDGLMGFDLKGKTLGVIGAGNIGLHVIRIAKGFGMDVLACDAKENRFLAEAMGFSYAPLESLLKRSDIITLHVPHIEATRHLINKDTIKLIKKGALLINTSRGSVVDTGALIEALDKKILSGIGLDVLEGEGLIKEEKQLLYDPSRVTALEELIKDHILLSRENVVFTPHIAFYSREALERIIATTADNILSIINNKPINVVS